MLYRDIARILGYYFTGFTLSLALPLLLAIYYQFFADPLTHPQPHSTLAFFLTIFACLGLGLTLIRLGRKSTGHFFRREALISVVLIWFMTPAIASLPFVFSGTLDDPFQAYFEAASGFSTTGATVMHPKNYNENGTEIPIEKTVPGIHPTTYKFYGTIEPVRNADGEVLYKGIEAVSKALLFWRSLTQWLGGMGIIVLFLAILPILGAGGKMLFHAEVPGPAVDSMTPRIKDTAISLWKIYCGMTLLQIALLMYTNSEMTLLDASTITFSTLSTGGFTIRNASIGYWNNETTYGIVLLFMFLGSLNFAYYYYAIKGQFYRIYEPELLCYIILLGSSCLFASYLIIGTVNIQSDADIGGPLNVWNALQYGFFQVVSTHTSTGFITADYDAWPYSVQVLMLITMYFGGMAGSTAGGIKIVRHMMLFRIAQYKVESLFRPENVRPFKLGRREITLNSALIVLSYFLIVIATSVVATFLFVLDGIDPQTSLSLVSLLINNVGIGFRMASPIESLAFLSNFDLVISCFLMIMGRLEFFAVLAVMVPAFWKPTS